MTQLNKKEELERRLQQSRRLLKEATDPTTKDRLNKLVDDLVEEQQQEKGK
jgi:TATA-binding protein-associated factor Taf7